MVFERAMRQYKMQMTQEIELYNKNVKIIDEIIADIDEEKKQHRGIMEAYVERIKEMKKKKIEKRKKLLVLQENQIKGKRVALVLKRDMESSMHEFDSVTDTLELTKIALREVQSSLQANYRALMR